MNETRNVLLSVDENNECIAFSINQHFYYDLLRNDKHLKVPTQDEPEILSFRKSKKRYSKWDNQLIDRFDWEDKISIVRGFEAYCKRV